MFTMLTTFQSDDSIALRITTGDVNYRRARYRRAFRQEGIDISQRSSISCSLPPRSPIWCWSSTPGYCRNQSNIHRWRWSTQEAQPMGRFERGFLVAKESGAGGEESPVGPTNRKQNVVTNGGQDSRRHPILLGYRSASTLVRNNLGANPTQGPIHKSTMNI